MKKETARQIEFVKLDVGGKFYLANPEHLTENNLYTKINTQKDTDGKWANAKNSYGLTTFVQYDKRVWKS